MLLVQKAVMCLLCKKFKPLVEPLMTLFLKVSKNTRTHVNANTWRMQVRVSDMITSAVVPLHS